MQRRTFVKSSILIGLSIQGCSKTTNYFWTTLQKVQDILLPQSEYGPSAKELNSTIYLKNSSIHSSFDTRDLKILKQGVKHLYNNNFLSLPKKKKEQLLNEFTQSSFGRRWTSLMLYYTIESIFCDPIYKGNKDQLGWKWVEHSIGYPRPKNIFAKVNTKLTV